MINDALTVQHSYQRMCYATTAETYSSLHTCLEQLQWQVKRNVQLLV